MNSSLCLHLLCIVSRLPVFADRWADDYYCPASPSSQKQALRQRPEELRRGREQPHWGQSAPLPGAQCWFSKLFARDISHRFVAKITSWLMPETIKHIREFLMGSNEMQADLFVRSKVELFSVPHPRYRWVKSVSSGSHVKTVLLLDEWQSFWNGLVLHSSTNTQCLL